MDGLAVRNIQPTSKTVPFAPLLRAGHHHRTQGDAIAQDLAPCTQQRQALARRDEIHAHFSDPYMVSQQFMLVRADEERFTTPREFADDENLLIGSQTGTTNFYVAVYEVLDGDKANPRIKLFENFGAAVQALIAGDVDMVLMDATAGRGYVGANPDKLKIVGDPLGTEEFGFIFTPGSDLVAPSNAAIEAMREDGFLDHLNTFWFFLYDPAAQ